MASPNEISTTQLSRLIGTGECPILIDVRTGEDFEADPYLLPAAFRHSFRDVADLAPQLKGARVVVYCHKGLKLSQGAAAILRNHGVEAEFLAGGHVEWRGLELPLIPAAKIPAAQISPMEGSGGALRAGTLWVTRHRPKIDRIACPWLIRRFIDPRAQFLFVAPPQVQAVAERFEASPFDIEGVFWSHRGEQCSFDVMIEEFGLHTEALDRLAPIIRGADTNRLELAPEAAGLLAAALGLSRMFRDDLAQLDAGMLLFDAFYRWARDASDEGHDWPAASTRP